ncbi:MAG: hypothetical protein ACI8ZO_001477 [Flavobacteriales bacterium]|jgi:hypothetical protein
MSVGFKVQVHAYCTSLLENRVKELQLGLKDLQEAANDNTKSSAGDKYETGRAMAHLEQEKQQKSLDNNIHLLQLLQGLDKPSKKIVAGALIQTKNAWFYISVSLGKLEIDAHTIYCISPQSPLAQKILNQKTVNSIDFNGQQEQILQLL